MRRLRTGDDGAARAESCGARWCAPVLRWGRGPARSASVVRGEGAQRFVGLRHARMRNGDRRACATVRSAWSWCCGRIRSTRPAAGRSATPGSCAAMAGPLRSRTCVKEAGPRHARCRHACRRVRAGQRARGRGRGPRRRDIERNHTATHLVHLVLRRELGTHVRQQGSLVEAGRLRFDFSHHAPIDPAQLADIEAGVNELVLANPVATPGDAAQRRPRARRDGVLRRQVRRRGARGADR